MRVWVTGGSGMLGGTIAATLRARNAVEVLTPRSREVDLTQADQVSQFIADSKPDVVVHAAGRVGGIAANIADPVGFLTENMEMGMNLITLAHKAGVRTLINIGSSCMFPRDHDQPLVEDDILTGPLEPTNEGYALAKIASERLCAYIARTAGRAYRTIVPSNLYGPGDHFDEHRGHLIANAMRKVEEALRTGAEEVEVWGDGSARREFTYVQDVASWIADLVGQDVVDQLPVRVNAGVGVDYTVREYYEHIASACGYRGTFRFDPTRPVGMKRKLMDSTLARGYGWTAPTALDEGLALTLAYYRTEVLDSD